MEFKKIPFLFTSAQLLEILKVTPSVKTQMTLVGSLGPRLTDPSARTVDLVGLFRFAEEKQDFTP